MPGSQRGLGSDDPQNERKDISWGNQDHFIDYRLIGREINMLKNVRSLTFRLFTEKEGAFTLDNTYNPEEEEPPPGAVSERYLAMIQPVAPLDCTVTRAQLSSVLSTFTFAPLATEPLTP